MNIEANKPMQKDAIFRVFSMSKPVCGAAIMMLLEEGKVRLNDPVSRFIPEFKGMKVGILQERPAASAPSGAAANYKVPASREVTIQDLLTHVSGLGSGGVSTDEVRKLTDDLASKTLASLIPQY